MSVSHEQIYANNNKENLFDIILIRLFTASIIFEMTKIELEKVHDIQHCYALPDDSKTSLQVPKKKKESHYNCVVQGLEITNWSTGMQSVDSIFPITHEDNQMNRRAANTVHKRSS